MSIPVPRIYLLISKYISIILEILMIIVVMLAGLWIQYRLSGGLLFKVEPLISINWSKAILVGKFFFRRVEFCISMFYVCVSGEMEQ
ncbi:hypothetical protein D3C73_546270 [compost metagenome]